MKVKLNNLKISHIVAGLPKKTVSVYEYEKFFDRKDIRRISESSGVEAVHVSDENLCASDYDVMLAEYLMEQTGWSGKDFDGLVFVSQSPDYVMPATSVTMQGRLGLPTTAVAFDLNFGCTGYVYGLYQAALLVSSGSCQRVLLFNGDTKVRMTHERDRATRLVMGDGFSLTVVERGKDEMGFNIHSDGARYDYVMIKAGGFRMPKSEETKQEAKDDRGYPYWPEYLHMNGLKMMNFAITDAPPMLQETLDFVGWDKSEVGTYGLHQANRLMIASIAEKVGIPMGRVPITLQHSGNTASASVPLMFSMKHKELEEQKRLSKVVIAGFGIGLSWGAVTADLSGTRIYDTLEL